MNAPSTSLPLHTVAFVTGANRGIGRALVEGLLARGAAKVYAAARRPESLADLVSRHGDRIVPLAVDVTDPAQVAAAAARAADATLVINNAGTIANHDLLSDDLTGARQEFEVNYWGVLHVTQAFARHFQDRGRGTFVNIASVAGLTHSPVIPTYSDSKAAVHSFTVGLRHRFGGTGIRVVGVYPGPVDTELARDLAMPKVTPAAAAAAILDGIAAGTEDIFPDPTAQGYAPAYEAGSKTLERRRAASLAPRA